MNWTLCLSVVTPVHSVSASCPRMAVWTWQKICVGLGLENTGEYGILLFCRHDPGFFCPSLIPQRTEQLALQLWTGSETTSLWGRHKSCQRYKRFLAWLFHFQILAAIEGVWFSPLNPWVSKRSSYSNWYFFPLYSLEYLDFHLLEKIEFILLCWKCW